MFILYLIFVLIMIYIIYRFNTNTSESDEYQEYNKIDVYDINFPKNFKFGLATASYQNEGNNHNNWTEWERLNDLSRCGISCDMWNTFKEDINNLKYLGVTTFRLSIEWSRIEQKKGKINYQALNKYLLWCQMLKDNNIEPIITLHHFTLPLWMDEMGSWENKDVIDHYLKYVTIVVKHLSKYVKYWITFNEPFMECLHGWLLCTRPPINKKKKMDYNGFFKALRNICVCHGKSYHIIHSLRKDSMVSIAKNVSIVKSFNKYSIIENILTYPLNKIYNHQIVKSLITGEINLYFINKTLFGGIYEKHEYMKNTLDFLGINHYNQIYLNFDIFSENKIDVLLSNNTDQYKKNQMGWDVVPEGMYSVVKTFSKYGLPILITENGLCDDNPRSELKCNYLIQSLYGISKAYQERINIIGYNYWTYCDNFEWEYGFEPRFGLMRVNYDMINFQNQHNLQDDTSKILTKCGELYKNIIKVHTLSNM